eukprot:1055342-Prymnesium_polylepis.3
MIICTFRGGTAQACHTHCHTHAAHMLHIVLPAVPGGGRLCNPQSCVRARQHRPSQMSSGQAGAAGAVRPLVGFAHYVGARFGICFACPPRYGVQFRGRCCSAPGKRDVFSLPLTGVTAHASGTGG